MALCPVDAFGCLVLAVGLNVPPAFAQADRAEAEERCSALANMDFSGVPDAPTQVTEAKWNSAQGNAPTHCEVQGYVTPQVGFEIRLPASNWNGKFLGVGCGGTCGDVGSQSHSCDLPLRRGYACIVSDMGHRGTGALWGYNNLPAEIDFAYRGTHVATLAGKAIAARYYSSAPNRSYFIGCSEGGRQAMVEAQRFPWDFDGILAGAPGINETGYYMEMLWDVRAMMGTGGRPILGADDLKLLHQSVLSACDKDDGISDGIIGNPSACRFDVSSLICKTGQRDECLTVEKANAVRKIYGGPTNSNGRKLTPGGLSLGSELNWIDAFLGKGAAAPWVTHESVTEPLRYLAFLPDPGPKWQYVDFDFDRDYQRLALMESLYTGSNPDLRKFKAVGGKLIAYQGWTDVFAPPAEIIDYYDTVVKTMGGRAATEEFFRLFVLPGVNHCSGGVGADAVDFLDYLESWVERGQAPDQILSAHVKGEPAIYPYQPFPSESSKIIFSRPVYPYPRRTVYKGSGDPNDAGSFLAVESSPP